MKSRLYFRYVVLLIVGLGFLFCSSVTNKLLLVGGYVDGQRTLTISFTQPITQSLTKNMFQVVDNDGSVLEIQNAAPGIEPQVIILTTAEDINIKQEYFVKFGAQQKRLIMNDIFRQPNLSNIETELGALYTPAATTFRLFAPRAFAVILNIYENPIITVNESLKQYPLTEKKGGIWEAVVKANLAGKYYTYRLKSIALDCHEQLEVVDPYAKLVTRGDGQSTIKRKNFLQTEGRGMIVDLSQTERVVNITETNFHLPDAIIYETHVRDFTRGINSGVPEEKKGLFVGAAQKGTRYKSFKTCLDHLIELGVNVVQFHPVNEFWVMDDLTYKRKFIDHKDENSYWHEKEFYNWGYAPINYFSLEGWYATDPNNLSRINEFKQLISEFHRHGIRVTLDVVFNHTYEGSRDQFAHWLFRGIDTDYYYRSFPDARFYDGIFCGNELKTENPMVAKYIIDCLKYWVTEFKVDGFRFDWMSAIDPETLNRIIRELRALNPNILLYGELWTLRDKSYTGKNSGTYVDRQHVGLFERDYQLPSGSIAGFNDYFRDAVKGSGFQRDYAGGYIQNVIDEIYYHHQPHELVKKAIKGMVDFTPQSDDSTEWQYIQSPLNSINYIACHDGYTLYDKLIIAAYCQYQEPGKPDSPKNSYPLSAANPNIVDFKNNNQFEEKNIEAKLKKMDKLGAAILLTSQGIPFLHSGMEFLRQKIKLQPTTARSSGVYQFDVNSNTSPDAVNAIRWELKEKNYNIFKYYQGLIELRRKHPTFRRTTAKSVRNGLIFHDNWRPQNSEACIAYQLIDSENEFKNESWKNVVVLINPYPVPKKFNIPTGNWQIVVNGENAGVETLEIIKRGVIELDGISLIVLHLS